MPFPLWFPLLWIPAPFFARWYYSFLRRRTADKPNSVRLCSHHRETDLRHCCFGQKENFRPWADWVCATDAIVTALLCWPLIGLIFFVMAKPQKTSYELAVELERRDKRIAELERAELDSQIDDFVAETEKEQAALWRAHVAAEEEKRNRLAATKREYKRGGPV